MLRPPDRAPTAPRWSREQIRAARLAPLPPLLERRGLALLETGGGNFAVSAYPGLIVKNCYWRWPERNQAGNRLHRQNPCDARSTKSTTPKKSVTVNQMVDHSGELQA